MTIVARKRLPEGAARACIVAFLRREYPEVLDVIDTGDAHLRMCRDGEDGWAWWVRLDCEADTPESWGWSDRETGTSYIKPTGIVEGMY